MAEPAKPPKLFAVRMPLDRLHEDPENVNLHDEKNLAAIRASLEQFGQVEPLIVMGQSGKVIGGNGRLQAMQALGWSECWVHDFDGSELQAAALAIALNRTPRLSRFDVAGLDRTLNVLRDAHFEVADLGFDAADLAQLDAEMKGVAASPTGGPAPAQREENDLSPGSVPEEHNYAEQFAVIIRCDGEEMQQQVYERLSAEGYNCRVVTT